MKIYQIEICNYCNLSCSYCPTTIQQRPKGAMSFETFKKTLQLAKLCNQKKIYLHNFGEPLLHPEIESFIEYAVNQGFTPDFFTNGILLDARLITKLYNAGLRNISISEHRKNELTRVLTEIDKAGVSITVTNVYAYNETRHNWSGQLEAGQATTSTSENCIFQKQNAIVVLWDGRINTCCINVEADTSYYVDDFLTEQNYQFTPISLCKNCGLMRADELLE